MIEGELGRQARGHIKDWIPEKSYRKEKKFQIDLQEYLDEQFNEDGGLGMDVGVGGGGDVPVRREYGKVNADIAVGDEVGIELKRDFTNSNKHRLSGQITDYQNEFPCVIVVACGISDMGGWRELKQEYSGGGLGIDQSEVHFIHKEKGNFGKDPSDDGGLLGDDLL